MSHVPRRSLWQGGQHDHDKHIKVSKLNRNKFRLVRSVGLERATGPFFAKIGLKIKLKGKNEMENIKWRDNQTKLNCLENDQISDFLEQQTRLSETECLIYNVKNV